MKHHLSITTLGVFAAFAASEASAAPVSAQFNPIAVYVNVPRSFGLAYDTLNDTIHSSEFNGSLIHTIKAYKNFTSAEMSLLPVNSGLKVISAVAGNLDIKGTTSIGSIAGGEEIAFDSNINQLVMRRGSKFVSFDPFTAANQNANYANAPVSILHDGLDVNKGIVWSSQDGFTGAIHKNGVLFATEGDSSQTFLPDWIGDGPKNTDFWSGVQAVGDSLYAVSVHVNSNTGKSRTIVRFDANTGALLSYDPDGDIHSARWEGLAFDGKYLYAADFTGNEGFGGRSSGNVYVFELEGALRDPSLDPSHPVPEASSLAATALVAGLGGISYLRRRRAAK